MKIFGYTKSELALLKRLAYKKKYLKRISPLKIRVTLFIFQNKHTLR